MISTLPVFCQGIIYPSNRGCSPPKTFLTPQHHPPLELLRVLTRTLRYMLFSAIGGYSSNRNAIVVWIKKHSFLLLGRQESAPDSNQNGAHNYCSISYKFVIVYANKSYIIKVDPRRRLTGLYWQFPNSKSLKIHFICYTVICQVIQRQSWALFYWLKTNTFPALITKYHMHNVCI